MVPTLEPMEPLNAQAEPPENMLDAVTGQTIVSAHEVIGHRTAKGGTLTVAARILSRTIDLITMMVLARVLRPADFGLVAIAMSVIYIVEAVFELPISQALVRLPNPTRAHYDTAFTLSLLRGCAVTIILSLTSWPFAHLYKDHRLLALVCWLSLAPASRGFVSPRLADFSRRFDFSPDFIMELIGKSCALIASIALALATHSYWSIAVGTLISPLATTAVSYVLAPYRPRLSFAALPDFSGFLGWITAAQVIGALTWQADRLLMGKLASRVEMGLFTTANDLSNAPLFALLGPLMRPLLSAFAHVRNDRIRLSRSYKNSANAIVTLALPILACESLLAGPAVKLLMGNHWGGAVVFLRLLPLSLIPSLFAAPLGPLVMAFNRTDIFFKRNLFELCVKLPLIIWWGIHFGFLGIIAARTVSELAAVSFSMVIVRRLLGIAFWKQTLWAWRSIVSAGAMALVIASFAGRLNGAHSTLSLAASFVAVLLLGVSTYALVLFTLWNAVGCPSGLEAMLAERGARFLRKRTTTVLPEAS